VLSTSTLKLEAGPQNKTGLQSSPEATATSLDKGNGTKRGSLSKSAIIGLGVGIPCGVALMMVLGALCFIKRRRKTSTTVETSQSDLLDTGEQSRSEADGNSIATPWSASADQSPGELYGKEIMIPIELAGKQRPVELSGDSVPEMGAGKEKV
jgi:hypothetical protein